MNINRFTSLLGYESTFVLMRAAKAVSVLSKKYSYSLFDASGNEIGKELLSEAEFIVFALQNGRLPKTWTDYPCGKCKADYCVSESDCTKGKHIYNMEGAKYGTEITKTGFDFANYLIEAGLVSYESVQSKIDADTAERDRLAQESAAAERERVEAEETEKRAEDGYQSWLQETVRNYGGINTPEGVKVLIQRDIFLDFFGEYYEHAKKLLVLIDNIDNPRCRRDIISQLHNGNIASIKTFECITGIRLAKTYKERCVQLQSIKKEDYSEQPKQYKPRKTVEKAEYNDVFYIQTRGGGGKGSQFIEAHGQLWKYKDYDFFIVKTALGKVDYGITEGKTGLSVGHGETIEKAKSYVKKFVNGIRDGKPLQTPFAEMVKQSIEAHGLSPLYSQNDENISGKSKADS